MLMTIGFEKPTPTDMEAWMSWFKSIGDKLVSQVGFMSGCDVAKDGSTKELAFGLDAITGCLVINSETRDEALEIAKRCPAITSTRVYEVRED